MDARQLKDEAAEQFGKGRYGKAATLYAQLAQLEPNEPQHRMRQGDSLRRDGKQEKALEAYDLAATQYAKANALLKAIAAYKLILEIDPAHVRTREKLAGLAQQRMAAPSSAPLSSARLSAVKPREETQPPGKAPDTTSSGLELDEPAAPPPPPADAKPTPTEPLELDFGGPPEPVAAPPPREEPANEPGSIDLGLDLEAPAAPAASPMLDLPAAAPAPTVDALELDPTPALDLESEPIPLPAVDSAKLAHVTAETAEEKRVLATAVHAATRAETPMEAVLAASMQDEPEFVDAADIGLVALPDENEPSLDEVTQERIPLFSELPHEAFLELLQDAHLRRVEPGDVIVREGDPGVSFFVLVKGTVRVVKHKGEAPIELATLHEGAFFGEMALLHGEARTASVIASTEADLLEIDQSLLRGLANSYPRVSKSIVRFYKERLLANVLSISPLFASLDPTDRPPLLQKFVMRDVPAEQVIIREGEKAEGLSVLMSGAALVTKTDRTGKVRPLALLREGDVFGEMSLLTRRPISATVIAKRPSILLTLPKAAFDEVISMYPTVLETVAELSELRTKHNAQVLLGATG